MPVHDPTRAGCASILYGAPCDCDSPAGPSSHSTGATEDATGAPRRAGESGAQFSVSVADLLENARGDAMLIADVMEQPSVTEDELSTAIGRAKQLEIELRCAQRLMRSRGGM
jgi:hypothetical protein